MKQSYFRLHNHAAVLKILIFLFHYSAELILQQCRIFTIPQSAAIARANTLRTQFQTIFSFLISCVKFSPITSIPFLVAAAWKLKYQFGFDDDTIKGIREAAEENAENDIKEYGSEEARKWQLKTYALPVQYLI